MAERATSDEHVIPRSIGGALALPLLCKPCNERLGHTIDAEALKSGPIQSAIVRLKEQVPWLMKARGHEIDVRSMGSGLSMQIEKGTAEPQARPGPEPGTGILNQPRSALGRKNVRKRLRNEIAKLRAKGVEPQIDLDDVTQSFMRLEAGEDLDIPELGLTFRGKQDRGVAFHFGPPLSHRYPARIAYLALIAAGANLKDPRLENWRRFIWGEIDDPLHNGVILCRPDAPTDTEVPYHYVEVSNKVPGLAIVDVVLFGCWCWRAAFSLSTEPRPMFTVIGVDLPKGETVVYVTRKNFEDQVGWVLPGPDPQDGWPAR